MSQSILRLQYTMSLLFYVLRNLSAMKKEIYIYRGTGTVHAIYIIIKTVPVYIYYYVPFTAFVPVHTNLMHKKQNSIVIKASKIEICNLHNMT
jgi:hypothetical protein